MAKPTEVAKPLATREAGAVADPTTYSDELLEFMGEHGREGKEMVRAEDIIIPRVAVIQALSPQVKERRAGLGDLFNIVTGANYGPEMSFIPLFFFTTQIMWDSPNPGASIECLARDGEHGSRYGACASCKYREFSTDNNGLSVQPKCTTFKNILLLPYAEGVALTEQSPAVFSGKRTGIREISAFITRATSERFAGRELPLYMGIWKVKTVEATNEKGSFYVPKFDFQNVVMDINEVRYLHGVYKSMKESQARLDIQQEGPGDTIDAESTVVAETTKY